MIILESIVLWVAAGCALLLIMQYVLKSPQTPERPEAGLGRRYPVGTRKLSSGFAGKRRAPQRDSVVHLPSEPVYDLAEPQAIAPPKARQRITVAAAAEPQPVTAPVQEAIEQTEAAPKRNTKRTDTMQMMLNRAISERR